MEVGHGLLYITGEWEAGRGRPAAPQRRVPKLLGGCGERRVLTLASSLPALRVGVGQDRGGVGTDGAGWC